MFTGNKVRQVLTALDNALVSILLVLIMFWRCCLSALFGARCRFHPACSQYTAQALRTHGVLKGSAFALTRLLRCNRLFAGGFDPVPPKDTAGCGFSQTRSGLY